jgi:hypothetical protein
MAALIKVEPDSDNETGSLLQQAIDEEGRAAPFTLRWVICTQSQIQGKLKNS